jgi:hypothetical protein
MSVTGSLEEGLTGWRVDMNAPKKTEVGPKCAEIGLVGGAATGAVGRTSL